MEPQEISVAELIEYLLRFIIPRAHQRNDGVAYTEEVYVLPGDWRLAHAGDKPRKRRRYHVLRVHYLPDWTYFYLGDNRIVYSTTPVILSRL